MRAKGHGLKLGSLTFLSVRLGSTLRVCQNARVVKVLKHAQSLIQSSIEEKCRFQELGMRGTDASGGEDRRVDGDGRRR